MSLFYLFFFPPSDIRFLKKIPVNQLIKKKGLMQAYQPARMRASINEPFIMFIFQ
jgi:hypothetical protein